MVASLVITLQCDTDPRDVTNGDDGGARPGNTQWSGPGNNANTTIECVMSTCASYPAVQGAGKR